MSQKDQKTGNQQGKLFLGAACLVIVFLGAVQVLVANRLATQGEVIKKYEVEAAWLGEENQKVANEIVKLSSLNQIASRSGDLAFESEVAVLYLPRPVVVALKKE